MKRVMKCLGIIVFIAVIGFSLLGCGDFVTFVRPSQINVVDNGDWFLFSWEAVGRNITTYQLYMKEEKTKSPIFVMSATHGYKYAKSSSSSLITQDTSGSFESDVWYAYMRKNSPVNRSMNVKFGVRSISGYEESDIYWTKDTYYLPYTPPSSYY